MENFINQNPASAPDTDVNTVEQTVAIAQPQPSEPQLDNNSLFSLLTSDSRVARFIVDVLHGSDPVEASSLHFTPSTPTIDVDAMLNEAEQRGYLRGRNEAIEAHMQQPSVWETPGSATIDNDSHHQILAHMRPSVWD